MKEQFKKYYVAEDKSNTGYAAYLAGLIRSHLPGPRP
jgi:hypothetical protein